MEWLFAPISFVFVVAHAIIGGGEKLVAEIQYTVTKTEPVVGVKHKSDGRDVELKVYGKLED